MQDGNEGSSDLILLNTYDTSKRKTGSNANDIPSGSKFK